MIGDWIDTGDTYRRDERGYYYVVDRTKDMVKSGGEWISSIELENIAMAHPAIMEAAIVARADERWGERPVLVAVLKPDATLTREDMRAHYESRTSKWCVPDDLVIVGELPHTATGKLSKKTIRRMIGAD